MPCADTRQPHRVPDRPETAPPDSGHSYFPNMVSADTFHSGTEVRYRCIVAPIVVTICARGIATTGASRST